MKFGTLRTICCAVIRAVVYIVFGVNIGHSAAGDCAVCGTDAGETMEIAE